MPWLTNRHISFLNNIARITNQRVGCLMGFTLPNTEMESNHCSTLSLVVETEVTMSTASFITIKSNKKKINFINLFEYLYEVILYRKLFNCLTIKKIVKITTY